MNILCTLACSQIKRKKSRTAITIAVINPFIKKVSLNISIDTTPFHHIYVTYDYKRISIET